MLKVTGHLLRRMSSSMTFTSYDAYISHLKSHSQLPQGFKVGTQSFAFNPEELPEKTAKMTLTLITLDKPTKSFAAMFTSNSFPGAPIIVGKDRLKNSSELQAVIINNKISNVCAPGGVEASEKLCDLVAKTLNYPQGSKVVLPSSTGVIGWKLPVSQMCAALPGTVSTLQSESIFPAAVGICTTDLFPKVRSAIVPNTKNGRIVAIGKGAGMIEPNLATMLVYILTDIDISQVDARKILPQVVNTSFNALSIDSDQSTSDTCVLLSSNKVPLGAASLDDFKAALQRICTDLAEDIVRNGEGVQHVIKVQVKNGPSEAISRGVGKSIVNSPLFKCAVAGNDPNVGRLVAAIGKYLGNLPEGKHFDVSNLKLFMGGIPIYSNGAFTLSPTTELKLVEHLKAAQLYESHPTMNSNTTPIKVENSVSTYAGRDVSYVPPIKYPPHEKCVEILVDLGMGSSDFTVLGNDLTHEYVAENADYRS
jgi:glutamate N-acetyltransferase / amino-acid N-acetyltransferase